MSDTLVWWIIAGGLVALELISGTFYLLMLALGAACGGVAAWLGLSQPWQIAAAAVVGGGAVWLWHRRQRGQQGLASTTDAADPNQLDVGAIVMVTQWQADGRTRVHYRGTDWQAQPAPGAPLQTGAHRIVAVESNHLVLAPSPTGAG